MFMALFFFIIGYIYYLQAGRSVSGDRLCPRSILKTQGTVFLNTDQANPANNVLIYFLFCPAVDRL